MEGRGDIERKLKERQKNGRERRKRERGEEKYNPYVGRAIKCFSVNNQRRGVGLERHNKDRINKPDD